MNKYKKPNLKDIESGTTLLRILGGELEMPVVVGDQDEEFIWVGSLDGFVPAVKEEGWKFSRITSNEVDEDLGWDGITKTGSYLRIREE